MADFKTQLKEAICESKREILGVVALAVNQDGDITHSHAAGKTHLSVDHANDIDADSVFPLASATKLITVIALLRLIQSNSSITIDDTDIVAKYLPELCNQDVISSPPGQPLAYEARQQPITLRQLLTHTSGSGSDILEPRLLAWRKGRGETPKYLSADLPEAIATPSLFQPGGGWAYGAGLDWVGLLIARITGENFSTFVKREVCDVVGCDSLIGFRKSEIEAQGGVVVQVVVKDPQEGLKEHRIPDQKSERGGGGMLASAKNYVKILADLIAKESKLLDEERMDMLFGPQLEEGGTALESLRSQAHIFKGMTGPLTANLPHSSLNHALGGLLITDDTPALGKSANTLAWGGAFGSMWFANREQGVAAFFGGCTFPPGQGKNAQLTGEFVKEVWKGLGE
ncbi:hypothetical protein ACN47E_005696 [Coniothyrium glycines]